MWQKACIEPNTWILRISNSVCSILLHSWCSYLRTYIYTKPMIRKRFEKAIPRTKPQHTTAVSRVAQGQGMFVSYQSLVGSAHVGLPIVVWDPKSWVVKSHHYLPIISFSPNTRLCFIIWQLFAYNPHDIPISPISAGFSWFSLGSPWNPECPAVLVLAGLCLGSCWQRPDAAAAFGGALWA